MRSSTTACLTAMLAATLLGTVSPRAEALDLTGTWQGRISCTGLSDLGKSNQYSVTPPIAITQTTADTFTLFETGAGLLYFGRVVVRANKPTQGAVMFVGCPTNNTPCRVTASSCRAWSPSARVRRPWAPSMRWGPSSTPTTTASIAARGRTGV